MMVNIQLWTDSITADPPLWSDSVVFLASVGFLLLQSLAIHSADIYCSASLQMAVPWPSHRLLLLPLAGTRLA